MRRKPGAELAIRPNKSQLKREYDALQESGEKLAKLPAAKLKGAKLPEVLMAALTEYQRLPSKHGAQRRQLQFIGKVMREMDEVTLNKIAVLISDRAQVELRKQKLEALRKTTTDGQE